MFHSLAADDTKPAGAVLPTFDALLIGPADDDGDDDVDAGEPTAASMFVWRTRAWLPPTRHQPKGNTP
ncbi:hypothetical protein E3T26_09395 [Cryobacterium sp. TMT1-21]|uniref:Uncharacterized protein n=1 Tax=Cryobacterium shii TaxID=1259235 RepID=A0AAQ2C6E7_9MICO|nr:MULTISPECIES: hypothetical protein [Cryobacterium]TFC47111.1 hypothetical protein E3O49_08990 [Cryobacterium shii]TFC85418.1 hypothetical protein E3T24_08330 [Cryobacterium sp. TmT2-59]TFD13096.1 hypothetical protein E3T42_14490 [Cryobacterium sp. TMT4-10]TFD13810.1 hypothetical protein E3T26_09395 [Cryobacterium sp. TMT1-21]TFD16963.1 hypothetical protein E3T32_14435 [Cryobacterium sp. TMT2-23]